MNQLKSLFGVLFLVICSLSMHSQSSEQQVYYRYFTVEVENLNQSEFNQFASARTASDALKFDKYCSYSSSILVRVDASLPKRIEDMKNEIRQALESALPNKHIAIISQVSFSDRSNFCK